MIRASVSDRFYFTVHFQVTVTEGSKIKLCQDLEGETNAEAKDSCWCLLSSSSWVVRLLSYRSQDHHSSLWPSPINHWWRKFLTAWSNGTIFSIDVAPFFHKTNHSLCQVDINLARTIEEWKKLGIVTNPNLLLKFPAIFKIEYKQLHLF